MVSAKPLLNIQAYNNQPQHENQLLFLMLHQHAKCCSSRIMTASQHKTEKRNFTNIGIKVLTDEESVGGNLFFGGLSGVTTKRKYTEWHHFVAVVTAVGFNNRTIREIKKIGSQKPHGCTQSECVSNSWEQVDTQTLSAGHPDGFYTRNGTKREKNASQLFHVV